jgi:cyclophilin family peptidyl-prolyl cis-trans isomerase
MRTNFVALLCGVVMCASVLGFDHPRVKCMTTKGPLVIEVYRDWAPLGADRFLELVKDDFFTDIAFFRCVKRFLTQFGISDVQSKKHWHREEIPDDPNLNIGIKKNYLSYAGGGPNTRSTQLFIAFEDLDFLGKEPWETPFGKLSCRCCNL